jgi:porphobilinogen deaminase
VVRALGADCRSAVGVHAAGGRVRAFVGAPDGSAWIADEVSGEGDGAAGALAARLLAVGAEGLLHG